MYYTKCKLERCETEFSQGGTGQFREEWVPTHHAVIGNLLRIDTGSPWAIIEVGKSVTIIKYIQKLKEDVLEMFVHKPWYELVKGLKKPL